MWFARFRPKHLDEVIGNQDSIKKIKVWALKWEKGEKQKPLILYGPPGVGKTLVSELIGKEMDWDIIMLDSSEHRDKNKLKKDIERHLKYRSIFNKKKILIIDDIEGFTEEDRGGITELKKIITKNEIPIIITTNDLWNEKLREIRELCTPIEFKKVNYSSIKKYLLKLNEKFNLGIDEDTISRIARNADGDVRSALNDLEGLTVSYRDVKENIFRVLAKIFKGEDIKNIQLAVSESDLDLEQLILWIEENIPQEYEDKKEIAKAYDFLSYGDIIYKFIQNDQVWSLLPFWRDLSTAGVSLSKNKKYIKFTSYKYPSILRKRKNRGLDEKVKELMKIMHTDREGALHFYLIMKNEI